MTDEEALAEIQRLARANRVGYTPHAQSRMRERNVRRADVIHVLLFATCASREPADRWRIDGQDRRGDELTVVVVVEANIIVITVF